MKMTLSRQFRVNQILLGVAFVFALVLARDIKAGDEKEHDHLVTDWSHRHMVFSASANYSQAWELQKEPRYFHQYLRQHVSSLMPADTSPNHGELEEQLDELARLVAFASSHDPLGSLGRSPSACCSANPRDVPGLESVADIGDHLRRDASPRFVG